MSSPTVHDAAIVRRATRGVYVVFIGSGLAFASWAARIPQVREQLDLSPGALGMVLLGIAVGSLLALPSAGLIVHRIGAAATIVVMSLVAAAGIAIASVGVLVGVAPVVIGLFVLTMAFAEGTANDWIGVAAIDGHGATAALGSLAYGVFVTAMTVGRWYGTSILDRFGRVPVLRTSAGIALVGLLVVVYGPGLVTAMVGAALWGLGTALGFPTGMSAAADQPRSSAGRVSVVATIGYVAFLAGPPLVGILGDRVGVLRALTVTAGLLAVGFLVAGATRPLADD